MQVEVLGNELLELVDEGHVRMLVGGDVGERDSSGDLFAVLRVVLISVLDVWGSSQSSFPGAQILYCWHQVVYFEKGFLLGGQAVLIVEKLCVL